MYGAWEGVDGNVGWAGVAVGLGAWRLGIGGLIWVRLMIDGWVGDAVLIEGVALDWDLGGKKAFMRSCGC